MKAVETVFNDTVDIVHDPYHVVTHANKALDRIRQDIANTLEGENRSYIKGTRYVLLKGLEKLSTSSMEKIMKLMEVNAPLYAAYLMKEELRMFWNCPDKQVGETFLNTWIADAQVVGLKPMVKIAKMLERHRKGLLSYFEHWISTGPREGLNNKLKVLKRQAYGFRDNEYFTSFLSKTDFRIYSKAMSFPRRWESKPLTTEIPAFAGMTFSSMISTCGISFPNHFGRQ